MASTYNLVVHLKNDSSAKKTISITADQVLDLHDCQPFLEHTVKALVLEPKLQHLIGESHIDPNSTEIVHGFKCRFSLSKILSLLEKNGISDCSQENINNVIV